MPNGRTVTRERLGAWVLRCNPKTWDIETAIRKGLPIEGWSVRRSYRTEMMEEGDPIVLWVSASVARIPSGVWADGEVTGPAEIGRPDELWLDDDAARKTEFFVPLWSHFLSQPVTREILKKDPILAKSEPFDAPKMSNPSWLTRNEFAALERLLRRTPRRPRLRPPSDTTVSVSPTDVVTKALVERAAVRAVAHELEVQGWHVSDCQTDRVGWDLTATRDSKIRHIEVKGRGNHRVDILLTPNERRAADEVAGWELIIVTDALGTPRFHRFSAADVVQTAAPFNFRFRHP
jgi:hypothetical protein